MLSLYVQNLQKLHQLASLAIAKSSLLGLAGFSYWLFREKLFQDLASEVNGTNKHFIFTCSCYHVINLHQASTLDVFK